MNLFRRAPQGKILLGDSRMLALRTERLREASGEDYFNFAYGGASLREMIDTFWFAARRTKLEKVYIGLSLNVYNDYNVTDRAKLFTSVEENPALYFVNRTVLESALYGAHSTLTGVDPQLGVPTMTRDAFWQDQLQNVTGAYYKSYVYPSKYKQELRKIADYCREHGIEFSFIIFPTHADARRLVADFRLERENELLRRDLAGLATVYDFDYENEVTTNAANFDDPNHYTRPVGEMIVREVWQGRRQYARKYESTSGL